MAYWVDDYGNIHRSSPSNRNQQSQTPQQTPRSQQGRGCGRFFFWILVIGVAFFIFKNKFGDFPVGSQSESPQSQSEDDEFEAALKDALEEAEKPNDKTDKTSDADVPRLDDFSFLDEPRQSDKDSDVDDLRIEPGSRRTIKVDDVECAFRWIPAGEFDMGSPGSESDRVEDEALHHVKLTRGFWLLETPVTQKLYERIMGTNPSHFNGDDLPVESVSYDDALKFCEKLSQCLSGGWKATLPTEAQWEYACRAGTNTPFWFGSELNGDRANCDGNFPYGSDKKGTYLEQTTPVKDSSRRHASNPWGLYDMHGNVWEWCLDWYGAYSNENATNPIKSENGSNGSIRVCRGGSWRTQARFCRSAYRGGKIPSNRSSDIGFRIVVTNDSTNDLPQMVVKAPPIFHSSSNPDSKKLADEVKELELKDKVAHPSEEALAWAESPNRKAGTRKTLKFENAEYGFCWIPAGEFDMGSPRSEVGRESKEILHHVKLTKGFWLLETPVTQKLYIAVMNGDRGNPSRFIGDNLPVERVSFDEALLFCEKLTELLPEGVVATLPTEAQWEYACRAGTKTPYGVGNTLYDAAGNPKANCNFGYSAYNGKAIRTNKTTPVKTYAPNKWGLYDMHGNVWELCLDWYEAYPSGSVTDPTGPESGSYRVCRGGSWVNTDSICRSAFRTYNDDRPDYNGSMSFRVSLRCK